MGDIQGNAADGGMAMTQNDPDLDVELVTKISRVPPPSFAPAMYCILPSLGLVGSLIIIYMFLTKSKLRSPANLLIVNLALADGTFLMCYPPIVNNMLVYDGGQGYGPAGCLTHSVITIDAALTSLLTMGLIAISRYIAIVHPQKKATLLTWKICGSACVYAWIHPILIMIPAMAGWGRLGWHPGGWLCAFDWTYNYLYNVVVFFFGQALTTVITCFCYIQIYLVYRRSKKRVASKDSAQKGPKKEEIRLAIQLIVVFAIYNICWTPYFTVDTFIYPDSEGPPWLYALMQILIACNSSVNIFIYLYFNQAFRSECQKVFCCKKDIEHRSNVSAHLGYLISGTQRGPFCKWLLLFIYYQN